MAKDENKKEFKNLKAELKKVVWPTPKQLTNNTIAVITIVLITAAIVFALDFIFEKVNEHGIEKLKSSIETKNEINSVVEENTIVDNNGNVNEENSENEAEGTNSEEQSTQETNSEDQTSEQAEEGTNSEEQATDNQVVE